MGSSFHRQGAAYRKDRFVIFRYLGRSASKLQRVTIDEERVCDKVEQKSSRGDTEVGLL